MCTYDVVVRRPVGSVRGTEQRSGKVAHDRHSLRGAGGGSRIPFDMWTMTHRVLHRHELFAGHRNVTIGSGKRRQNDRCCVSHEMRPVQFRRDLHHESAFYTACPVNLLSGLAPSKLPPTPSALSLGHRQTPRSHQPCRSGSRRKLNATKERQVRDFPDRRHRSDVFG